MPTTFIPLDYLHEMSHETSHMGKKIKIFPKKVITFKTSIKLMRILLTTVVIIGDTDKRYRIEWRNSNYISVLIRALHV